MTPLQKQQKIASAVQPNRHLYQSELEMPPGTSWDTRAIIHSLLGISAPRLVRTLFKRGFLAPFDGSMPPRTQLRFIGPEIVSVPDKYLTSGPVPPPEHSFKQKREALKERRRTEVRDLMLSQISRPNIYYSISIVRDETPTMEMAIRHHTSFDADLSVPPDWHQAFSKSNEQYIVIELGETETVSEDTFVAKAKAWTKQSIRAGEPKEVEVWVAWSGATTSVTKSRATALRGASVRAKNEIVRRIW